MNKQHKRVKYACYSANMTMSAVGNISPVLFLTFRSLYGISYSLLGMLVLINFVTQLIIDLVNRYGEGITREREDHLKEIFVNCSRYEADFWTMAYNTKG